MKNGTKVRSARSSRIANADELLVEPSSGNVFADLGLPHPEIELMKAELVWRIRELISQQKLNQTQAARLLKIDQPKVSGLVRGKVSGYSIDRLFRFLNALGQRIEITIRPANGRPNKQIAVRS